MTASGNRVTESRAAARVAGSTPFKAPTHDELMTARKLREQSKGGPGLTPEEAGRRAATRQAGYIQRSAASGANTPGAEADTSFRASAVRQGPKLAPELADLASKQHAAKTDTPWYLRVIPGFMEKQDAAYQTAQANALAATEKERQVAQFKNQMAQVKKWAPWAIGGLGMAALLPALMRSGNKQDPRIQQMILANQQQILANQQQRQQAYPDPRTVGLQEGYRGREGLLKMNPWIRG